MTMDLAEHLKEFFHVYLRDQRGVSPNTIKNYRDGFKLLIAYVSAKQRKPRPLSMEDLDVKTILAFLGQLEAVRGNGASTRNARLAALQSFFKYLSLTHPGLERHAKRVLAIPAKRTPPVITQYLSRKEIEALLAQPNTSGADGMRDLALLTFLYNTGARAQEVADAKASCFDFPNRTVTITGKGGKERITPLWRSTVDLLKLYQKEHRRKPRAGMPERFFINQRGGPFTRFGIRVLVKRYILSAAKSCPSLAGRKLSAHSMRHTCASHLLESQVEPNVIKAWLGHASIQSTERYLHTDLSHKRRILDRFGPPQYVASSLQAKQQDSAGQILGWLTDL